MEQHEIERWDTDPVTQRLKDFIKKQMEYIRESSGSVDALLSPNIVVECAHAAGSLSAYHRILDVDKYDLMTEEEYKKEFNYDE